MFKRIAVTGAAGLIGSAVVRQLESLGVEVTAFDAVAAPVVVPLSQTPLLPIDILDSKLLDLLEKASPQALVHAAAHPGGKSLREPVEDVRVNALASMKLFDWCARSGCHVYYLSSSVVYGNKTAGNIVESNALSPGTIYGVAKQACEQWLDILGRGSGLRWTILRLFATYGAGHRPSIDQGIVNIMLTQLLSGRKIFVKGSLDRIRDLIYVDDVASVIVRALSCPEATYNIFNVGTGVGVTIREMIYLLTSALAREWKEIELVEEIGTVGDPFSNVADISKMKQILGYDPIYSLRAGLQALVEQRSAHLAH